MVFSARANVACGILVHSTYSLPDGFIVASESFVDVDKETQTGGHVVGKIQIVSGIGSYQGMTGTGAFDGDCSDKSPLKGVSGREPLGPAVDCVPPRLAFLEKGATSRRSSPR
jgi:hypothetical protein